MVGCGQVGAAGSMFQGEQQNVGNTLPLLLLKTANRPPSFCGTALQLQMLQTEGAQCRSYLQLQILPLAEDNCLLPLANDLPQPRRHQGELAATGASCICCSNTPSASGAACSMRLF